MWYLSSLTVTRAAPDWRMPRQTRPGGLASTLRPGEHTGPCRAHCALASTQVPAEHTARPGEHTARPGEHTAHPGEHTASTLRAYSRINELESAK